MAMGDSDLISLNVLQGTFNWLRNRPNSILMPRYDLHEQTRPSAKHLVISIHRSYSSDYENEYNFFFSQDSAEDESRSLSLGRETALKSGGTASEHKILCWL